jgi:hypothetical protein
VTRIGTGRHGHGRSRFVVSPCMTTSAYVKGYCLAEKSIEERQRGEAGVKGAFFAFISTLEAGLPTPHRRVGNEAQRVFF